MSKSRKIKPTPKPGPSSPKSVSPRSFSNKEKKALGQIKKVGEINFLQIPDGKIAIPMILSPDIKLGAIISAIDDIQERLIAAYKHLGQESTGSDYVKHETSKQSTVTSKQSAPTDH